MKFGTENEYLEIALVEKIPGDLPGSGDIQIDVSVRFKEFLGRYEEVWIESGELETFISDLKEVEIHRKGTCKLTSMSPDEFKLVIASYDSLGHFEAMIELTCRQYSDENIYPVSISGGFVFDPSQLPVILKEFQRLRE